MRSDDKKDPIQDLINDANQLTLFGKFEAEHFIDYEEKERERKFLIQQKEREKEIRRQAKKREEEEIEYKKFLDQQDLEMRKSKPSGQVSFSLTYFAHSVPLTGCIKLLLVIHFSYLFFY
jgi:hypothetical protein